MKKNIIVIGGCGRLRRCFSEVVNVKDQMFSYLFLFKEDLNFPCSNEGAVSWCDFVKTIFEFAELDMKFLLVASSAFITKSKQASYSVIDKTKIQALLGIEISYWRDRINYSLQNL